MINKLVLIFFIGLQTLTYSQKVYTNNYYPNGSLASEGWLDKGNKIEFWTFYYENGNKKKEGHFKNNLPTKYWYFYRWDSSLEKEGHYSNGKQNKWWLFYDKEGNLNHKCQLKDNQKDGYCLLYEENKLVKALRFSNNKKVNEWTDFSSFKKENSLMDLK